LPPAICFVVRAHLQLDFIKEEEEILKGLARTFLQKRLSARDMT